MQSSVKYRDVDGNLQIAEVVYVNPDTKRAVLRLSTQIEPIIDIPLGDDDATGPCWWANQDQQFSLEPGIIELLQFDVEGRPVDNDYHQPDPATFDGDASDPGNAVMIGGNPAAGSNPQPNEFSGNVEDIYTASVGVGIGAVVNKVEWDFDEVGGGAYTVKAFVEWSTVGAQLGGPWNVGVATTDAENEFSTADFYTIEVPSDAVDDVHYMAELTIDEFPDGSDPLTTANLPNLTICQVVTLGASDAEDGMSLSIHRVFVRLDRILGEGEKFTEG